MLLALSLACGGKQEAKRDDAAPRTGPIQDQAPGARGIAELAGEWTASAQVPTVGMALAVLTLGPRGRGQYLITVAGHQESGQLTVMRFRDHWLVVRAAGTTHSIWATLRGDSLFLDLPVVGSVRATRNRER